MTEVQRDHYIKSVSVISVMRDCYGKVMWQRWRMDRTLEFGKGSRHNFKDMDRFLQSLCRVTRKERVRKKTTAEIEWKFLTWLGRVEWILKRIYYWKLEGRRAIGKPCTKIGAKPGLSRLKHIFFITPKFFSPSQALLFTFSCRSQPWLKKKKLNTWTP